MAEFDQDKLEAAITGAIAAGFASSRSGTGGGSTPSSPRPPTDDSGSPTPDISPTLPSLDDDATTAAAKTQREETIKSLKRASGTFTGFAGGVMKMLGESTKMYLDGAASLNKELDEEISYFRQIQESFGGVTFEAFAAGEAIGGLAGQALDAQLHLGQVGSAGKESALEIKSGAMAGKNALLELFQDPLEPAKMFSEVMIDVADTNFTLAQSLQEQGDAEMERIAVIRKRMGVDSRTMGNILRREYAFTGEASSKIFEDIASVSVALSEQTGASANDLKSDILDIMQDTKLFGDIGVDSAGRIATSLNQLGLDFQTFKSMTSQFMNFDSAAEKMGDLSALFGIQMDAMEMTYLANEDQEEFLFRMREEILDAGLDVENMSKTRQRALTDQLGLESIEQMRQFMDTGIQPDQVAMEAATDSAKTMDGMATAIDKFGGAYEGSYRGAAEFEESLRNQARYTSSIAEDIAKVRKESGLIPGEFQNFQLPPDAIESARKMLALDFAGIETFRTKLAPAFKALGEMTANFAAETVNTGLEFVGIEALSSGDLNVKGEVKVATDEKGQQVITQVNESANKQSERHAQIENKTMELAVNQESMQTDVTGLIDAMKEDKNINVTFQLNDQMMATQLFNILQEKKGTFAIRPDQ